MSNAYQVHCQDLCEGSIMRISTCKSIAARYLGKPESIHYDFPKLAFQIPCY